LNTHGFQYLNHASNLDDFSKANIESVYLPEVETLLRSELEDVDGVFIFDWRLRKALPEAAEEVIDLNDFTNWLRRQLLKGRVRVINVWRPLVNSVNDLPLAVCDGRTVVPEDLIETDHVRRDHTGATMYLKHNRSQRFHYMSAQGKSDVLMFKNFDSSKRVESKYAPHVSFRHPNPAKEGSSRESIEVRALVFTDYQSR